MAEKDKKVQKPLTRTPASATRASATTGRTPASATRTSATTKSRISADEVVQVVKKHATHGNRASARAKTGVRKTNNAKGAEKSRSTEKTIPYKPLIFIGAAVLLCAVLVLCLVLGVRSCGKGSGAKNDVFVNPYKTVTQVGYNAEYLGTVQRKIPSQTQDGGLSSGYPTYGSTLRNVIGVEAEKTAMRNALIGEANRLCTVNTANAGGGGGYNRMDAEGNLYLNDAPALENGVARKLYKHTASVGMYLGDVSDEEPGIIKKLTFRPRAYTSYYSVTGLYAPAGEVIKVEISEEDMNATNGIVVHIGQALYNGQANNIWTAKNAMNRMPVILNTMVINKDTATLHNGVYTAYVGSFLGGPLYVRDERVTFSVTVSGAVKYSHFILGYTTPEDFAENAKSSAPYFDLEVWENGVLHSGPVRYAKSFDYDAIYNAAVLWDKISLVSTQVSTQGVVFLYDPFVAAGAAVAFPGRRSVNCPAGWMGNSLNYDSFVASGAWGNMHEYNHNFQGWGRGAGGEVTNNALNLVSYSLFTKISAARRTGSYGAEGLGGWNSYTSATWALSQALSSNRQNDLSVYAAVLHNLGQDMFIRSVQRQRAGRYGQSMTSWARAITEETHQDMTYFYNA